MADKFVKRTYRSRFKNDNLIYFDVTVKETDLKIGARRNLYDESLSAILKYRKQIEEYGIKHPEFLKSFKPIKAAPNASFIIKKMCNAAGKVNVGPMAAVAGAFSQTVGSKLLKHSKEVLVENGGDLYVNCKKDIKVGIFAGDSPFRDKLALKIKATDMPLGICTSSGKIGHSVSLGNSDAVTVLSKDTYLADAAATCIANKIKKKEDLTDAVEFGKTVKGIIGVAAIFDDKIGIWGDVELVPWS